MITVLCQSVKQCLVKYSVMNGNSLSVYDSIMVILRYRVSLDETKEGHVDNGGAVKSRIGERCPYRFPVFIDFSRSLLSPKPYLCNVN